ncbi:hypothetical protein SAMN05216559_3226 [Halomicrobium zhouii]|uniref:Uncharacterized protein n=1 Tax=Halomicrobium zhouii TaxID=767519 RepID=A0A1I6LVM1_9EURY|nr:hypothetical protein [Halomicrobium zhouii]SFS07468.1 hypothetical protein SAMN05216559_3226 [Halomicrobium zhouii]
MSIRSATRNPVLRRTFAVTVVLDVFLVHAGFRYIHLYLFGSVSYGGLAPVVPWLVLGSYVGSLALLAVVASRRADPAHVAVGVGLLLFAIEPFTILNGGCEVATGAEPSSALPGLMLDGLAVVVSTPGGACSASLNIPLITAGALSLGGGLWFASATDAFLERLLSVGGYPDPGRD